MFRIVNRLLLGILALCFVTGSMPLPNPARPSSRPDLPDTLRRLSGAGEIGELPRDVGKVYRVPLKKGELIHISAKQMGADVALVMIDPARNDLFKVDSFATTEQLFYVAPEAGVYGVRVEDGGAKTAGRYLMRVEDFRVADDWDRKNAQAETAYYTAKKLRSDGSLKDAEADLRYAIQSWQDLGNKARQADAYYQLSLVRSAARDFDGALSALQQSTGLRAILRDFQGQADALQDMARILAAQEQLQRAKGISMQVLEIRRRGSDKSKETDALYDLASVEEALGNYESALDHFSQAIDEYGRQKRWDLESQALNGRGIAYYKVGMMDLALDDADRALRLVAPSDLRNQAVILSRKAMVYQEQGKLDEALFIANQASALRKQARDARGEGVTLNDLGVIYFRLNRLDDALNAFQRSAQIFRDGGHRKEMINSMVNLGWLHAVQGRLDLALKIFNEGLSLAHAGGDRPTEAKLLHGIAYAERKRGNPIAAMARVDEAIAIAESLRSSAERRDVRQSFLADHEDLYGLKIEILMEQRSVRPGAGYALQAFQASERARARGLSDALAEEGQRDDPPPDLLQEHQKLQEQINALDQQLQSPNVSEPEKARSASHLRSLIGQDQDLEARMRQLGGWMGSPGMTPSLSLWEIQKRILDRDTALVEYYLGGNASFVWAVTPTSFQSYEIDCPDLRELARRVYQNMAEGASGEGEAKATEDLERLSACVLGKVGNVLSRKRILVISHDELQKIPFAALLEPGTRPLVLHGTRVPPYLALRHEIIDVPSVAVLSMLRKQRATRPAAKRFLSLVADAVYNSLDDRFSREAAALARRKLAGQPQPNLFSRLLGSGSEAHKIVSMAHTHGLDVDVATGFLATREWVKQGHLLHSRVAHFATHGVLNDAYPQLSGLVLSQFDLRGRRHDGLLRVHEIEDLKLDADLVVLSACQTALGKNVRGEGLVGLTQAFLIGGASSVLVSLWKIDDRASAEMMSQFYRYLLENRPPATALKLAQEHMIEREHWRSPFYWSGFVLKGEWRQGGLSRKGPRKER